MPTFRIREFLKLVGIPLTVAIIPELDESMLSIWANGLVLLTVVLDFVLRSVGSRCGIHGSEEDRPSAFEEFKEFDLVRCIGDAEPHTIVGALEQIDEDAANLCRIAWHDGTSGLR
ncbi:hypothetical protein I6F07_07650 [Ensifer sp. IC4062]|nr:hypothetical protein [Ensifer sp. IC4062]MCA1440100.1 hypothetical protein [Ensifer sp. IC4062]